MTAFLEIVFPAGSLSAAGIASRQDIEEPIDEALTEAGLGDVSGAGSGMESTIIDVEIDDASRLDEALQVIIRVLQEEGAPVSTKIIVRKPTQAMYLPLSSNSSTP